MQRLHTHEFKRDPGHIKTEKGNGLGNDYIIGNIRGRLDALEAALEKLKPYDRLFITGNLHGKGPDSLKVIQRIIAYNKHYEAQNYPQRIFVTRGNHEEILIKFFTAHKESKQNPEAYQRAKINSQNAHHDWAIKLAESENPNDQKALAEVVAHLKQLPYIAHVKDIENVQPFFIVHADLPFETQAELRSGEVRFLDENQLKHCISAKMNADGIHSNRAYGTKKTTMHDYVVYCSNSPLEGIRLPGFRANIDSGTSSEVINGAILLVNHTQQTAEILNQEKITQPKIREDLTALQNQTSVLLDYVPRLQRFQETLDSIMDQKEKYTFANLTAKEILEMKETSDSAKDFILLHQKLHALNDISQAFTEIVSQPFTKKSKQTPLSLAENVNRTFVNKFSVLMQGFKVSPNKNLTDHHIGTIADTFIDKTITIDDKTILNLTSTPEHAFVIANERFEPFDWQKEPFEPAFKLFIKIIQTTPKAHWFKLRNVALSLLDNDLEKLENSITLLHTVLKEEHQPFEVLKNVLGDQLTPLLSNVLENSKDLEKLKNFAKLLHEEGYQLDEALENVLGAKLLTSLPNEENFKELYESNRRKAHNIIQYVLKHNKEDTWHKFHFLTKIMNKTSMDDMHEFIMGCGYDDIKKFFSLPHHQNLITCVSAPSCIADRILRLPRTSQTRKEIKLKLQTRKKINLIFQRYATKNAKTEKQIKSYYSTILNRCLEHHGKTELSDKIKSALKFLGAISTKRLASLENIYRNFILILETGDVKELRSNLVNTYLSLRASRNGAGSDLGHALQKWLKSEFKEVPSSADQTVSAFSELVQPELGNTWNMLCDQFIHESKTILGKPLRYNSQDPLENEKIKNSDKTSEHFDMLIQQALGKLAATKKKTSFISFFSNPHDIIKIEQLRKLLAKYNVFVPYSFSANKVETKVNFYKQNSLEQDESMQEVKLR